VAEYRWRNLRIDLDQGLLYRDDAPIHLQPKQFAVLKQLVEARGEIVTNGKLIKTVWDNRVSGNALKFAVHGLRRALQPDGDLVILNVARVGYRSGVPWTNSDESTSVIPPTQHSEVLQQVGPRGWRSLVLVSIGLGLFAAVVALWLSRRGQDKTPRVIRYTALTNDGLLKTGPLLTDGQRIYFYEQTRDGDRPVSVRVSGGDALPLKVAGLDAAVRPVDLSADGKTMLLFSNAGL
jgi:DNA-binding winged helix-turn-helix (wHTH) protein